MDGRGERGQKFSFYIRFGAQNFGLTVQLQQYYNVQAMDGLFTHGPSGSQWSTGAAGCVVWSGVKLSDVIEYLGGIQGKQKYLTSTGGDPLPEGVDPLAVIVERSIPIEKAMKDAMLAWEMNGAHISLEHGGPLRLIVPAYFGCNQIKYIKSLAFTQEETKSKIQKSRLSSASHW